MTRKTKYKHIVFDVDGTLLDSQALFESSLLELLNEYHCPVDERAFRLFGLAQCDMMKLYNIEPSVWADMMVKWCDKLLKPLMSEEMKDGLRALKSAGYQLGIVSARPTDNIRKTMQIEGVASLFGRIVGSEETVEQKPAAAPLLYYCKQEAVERKDVLYLGDTDVDMNCAVNAKVDFGQVTWFSNTKTLTAAEKRYASVNELVEDLVYDER